jgi:hypothetical protein
MISSIWLSLWSQTSTRSGRSFSLIARRWNETGTKSTILEPAVNHLLSACGLAPRSFRCLQPSRNPPVFLASSRQPQWNREGKADGESEIEAARRMKPMGDSRLSGSP